MVIEQEQRVIADRLEVTVVGATLLLPMNGALAGIHVEHDAVGSVQRLGVPIRKGSDSFSPTWCHPFWRVSHPEPAQIKA